MNAGFRKASRPVLPTAGREQSGFSMIEMMISVSVGLMVMAAVMYTVTNTSASGRRQEVKSTGHDEGNLAMIQLAEHVRMSGFSTPDSEVVASDVFADGGSSLLGCRHGFADPGAAWADLRCADSKAGNSDALALRFQPVEGGRNWDCLGNAVVDAQTAALLAAASANAPGDTKVDPDRVKAVAAIQADEIQEIFYIKTRNTLSGNPGLYCRSNVQAGKEQLLADNVDQFRIRYGLSELNPQAQGTNKPFDERSLSGRTAMYRTADQLDRDCSPGTMPENSWCTVNSVQLCLVMRSDDNVNEEANTPYVDCEGQVRQVNDRRLRQAFSMTVAVRNKIGDLAVSTGGTP